MRSYEDFTPGSLFDLGTRQVSKQEIVDFARAYDPQPFHMDEDAGRQSLLGGLAASGWHTISILMRMTYDAILFDTRSLGSPGVETLKWVRPVLAGDTLSGHGEVLSARPLKSRPGIGIARFRFELNNQNGDLVLVQITSLLVERLENK